MRFGNPPIPSSDGEGEGRATRVANTSGICAARMWPRSWKGVEETNGITRCQWKFQNQQLLRVLTVIEKTRGVAMPEELAQLDGVLGHLRVLPALTASPDT